MQHKKKNRSDLSSRPKGAGQIHLEDLYTVDFSTLPIDFVLLKGHVCVPSSLKWLKYHGHCVSIAANLHTGSNQYT